MYYPSAENPSAESKREFGIGADDCVSSIALVSRTAADTLALGIRASVRLKPRGLESR